MPYFTTETILEVAEQYLVAEGKAPNVANARNQLLVEGLLRRLDPVPDEPAPKPEVLFDIFLSHSSLDRLQVLGIYRLLIQRGYRVYLDQVCDPYLDRTQVTRVTARIIRYRMVQCRSVFVATSANTTQSRWVPWELGYMDGWNGKAAVLPIVPSRIHSFKGQEYFELYPEVRDAGLLHTRPNDLEIHELPLLVEPWGVWVSRPRIY